jgi:Mg/Co/Ni transporter MgtE
LNHLGGAAAAAILSGTVPDALAAVLGKLESSAKAGEILVSIAREGEEGTKRAAAALALMDSAAAAAALASMEPSDAATLMLALDDESRARLLATLSLDEQAAILAAIPPQAYIGMDDDTAADLLTLLGAEKASATLIQMALLGWAPACTSSRMQPTHNSKPPGYNPWKLYKEMSWFLKPLHSSKARLVTTLGNYVK